MSRPLIAIIIFTATLGCTLLFVWQVRRIAVRLGLFGRMGDRHLHTRAIPRLGGVGIFMGFCLGVAFSFALPVLRFPNEVARIVLGVTMPLAFIWVVTSFRRRSAQLSRSATVLADRLDAFVNPSRQVEEQQRTIGATLKRQAEELSEVLSASATRLQASADGLGGRMNEVVTSVNSPMSAAPASFRTTNVL